MAKATKKTAATETPATEEATLSVEGSMKDQPERGTDVTRTEMTGVTFKKPGLYYYSEGGEDFVPRPATESSAGADVKAYLPEGAQISYYDHTNTNRRKAVKDGKLQLYPGERALIPTGLKADIPENLWLAIYPRSGTSYKKGLALNNSVAVIDNDYVEEIFISVANRSGVLIDIEHGERIAQAILQPQIICPVYSLKEQPKQKTSRAGGFGSTGSK